jgi:hypothetical protein
LNRSATCRPPRQKPLTTRSLKPSQWLRNTQIKLPPGNPARFMPLGHGDLTGDDGGAASIAIFENFQEVVPPLGGQGLKTPIID